MHEITQRIASGELPLHSLGGLLILFLAMLVGWGCCSLASSVRKENFEYKKKKAEGTVRSTDTPTGLEPGVVILFLLYLLMTWYGWSAMVGHWV